MGKFKAGNTYTLRADGMNDFCFTDSIRDKVGIMPGYYTTFTFTPTVIHPNGDAFIDDVFVATSGEFGLFDLVDEPKTPKVKKPFKVGATYKLKKKYIRDFRYTSHIEAVYGSGVFSFTVSHTQGSHIYAANVERSSIAIIAERHMFKRIDNK